jgi:hypothetical protein
MFPYNERLIKPTKLPNRWYTAAASAGGFFPHRRQPFLAFGSSWRRNRLPVDYKGGLRTDWKCSTLRETWSSLDPSSEALLFLRRPTYVNDQFILYSTVKTTDKLNCNSSHQRKSTNVSTRKQKQIDISHWYVFKDAHNQVRIIKKSVNEQNQDS